MKSSDLINSLKPSDFDTKDYDGIHIFNKANRRPIILMRSKKAGLYHWCIVNGFESTFYKTYNEAIGYCKSRGWVK